MTNEEKNYWYAKAKEYAESHLDNSNPDKNSVWLRDALFVAYLTAIQEYTKTRLL